MKKTYSLHKIDNENEFSFDAEDYSLFKFGQIEIAKKFELVAKIEEKHYERYKRLLENVVNDEVFTKKTGISVWKCRNCGNIVVAKSAPEVCPVCEHSQAYFELNCENY